MTGRTQTEANRLGDTIRLRIAGIEIDLVFSPRLRSVQEEVLRLWAHVATEDCGDIASIRLRFGAPGEAAEEAVSETLILRPCSGAAYAVSGALTSAVIDHLVGRQLLLHAAAVDHGNRGVIVLIGESGAGKSTAASELGRTGRYLTDELTIIDPATGTVTGYPKPVSRGGIVSGKLDVALDELGLVPALTAEAPSMIVLLDRRRDEAAPAGSGDRITRLRLGEALLRLVPQTSSLWRVHDGLAETAALLHRAGGTIVAHYEQAEHLGVLLETLPAPLSEEWSVIDPDPIPQVAVPGECALAPFTQALELETGAFVLAPGRGAHLDGLSGVVWLTVRWLGPCTPSALTYRVIEEIGPHRRAEELVREAVEALIDEGWLIRGR